MYGLTEHQGTRDTMEESYCNRKSAYYSFKVVTTCSNIVCLVEVGIPNAKTKCLRFKSDRPGCQIFCPSTATIFGRQRFPQVSVQLGAVHLLSRSAILVFHFPIGSATFLRRVVSAATQTPHKSCLTSPSLLFLLTHLASPPSPRCFPPAFANFRLLLCNSTHYVYLHFL